MSAGTVPANGVDVPARLARAIGLLLLAAAAFPYCAEDSTSPGPTVTLSASRRSVSFREDSALATADSVAVTVAGANAATATWVATHGGGTWLTLTSSSGTGNGVVRWTRDTTGLISGTWVDTITVTLVGSGGVSDRLVDSVIVREFPEQFITVRRAWRPGERDSTAAWVVRTGAWGEYSGLAPLAYAAWDSAVEVVPNPAWSSAAAARAGPRSPAPSPMSALFAAGWSGLGLDILLVFDSVPGGTIQRDSLDWISTRWWNPADSTWKGWIIRATTANTFGYQTVNTTAFDASGGNSGVGAGEARLATPTYWEGNGGRYRITSNGSYGAYSTIASGPYQGGNVAFGRMGGQLNSVRMPRVLGTDTPATATISWNFTFVTLNSQRIRCYFPPITPPTGYTSCTGPAFARLVAAAQAHRLTPRMAAGFADSLFALLEPSRRSRRAARRRRRASRTASRARVAEPCGRRA